MHKLLRAHKPKKHARSFKYAFDGVFHTLLNEPNFRVQIIIVVFVVFAGLYFNISPIEWALITITLGILLSAEMINTVIEHFMDLLIKEYDEGAKVIKDVSAGFVLISAISSLVVFILIFGKFFF